MGRLGNLLILFPISFQKSRIKWAILGDSSYVIHHQVAGGIVVPLSQRLVACLGVDDLVIVDTPDALLVTTRARSQVEEAGREMQGESNVEEDYIGIGLTDSASLDHTAYIYYILLSPVSCRSSYLAYHRTHDVPFLLPLFYVNEDGPSHA